MGILNKKINKLQLHSYIVMSFKLKSKSISFLKAKELLENGYKIVRFQDTHGHGDDWEKHLTQEFVENYALNENLKFQGEIGIDMKNFDFSMYAYDTDNLELLELYMLLRKCDIYINFNIFLCRNDHFKYVKFDDYDDKQTPNFSFDEFIYDLLFIHDLLSKASKEIIDVYLNEIEIYFVE